MKYLYIYFICMPAMIIHLLAFAFQFLLFSSFCQGYMLHGFLLFWRALSCFLHVASCVVVKSALTQSSYLLVVSVFVGDLLAVYTVYTAFFRQFRVYEYAIPLNSAHKRG